MLRPIRLRPAPVATILALVVAACSQGGTPTQVPPTTGGGGAASSASATAAAASSGAGGVTVPAACDLLSRDDFVEILGTEATKSGESNLISAYTTSCEWTFAGVTIVLGVISPGGSEFLDRTVEYEGGKEVDGLGDRAVRTDTSGTLLVLQGDTLLDLQSIGAGDDVDRILLERVLANL